MEGLRSFVGWTKGVASNVASNGGAWILGTYSCQAEAQRYVEDGHYILAERRLAQAVIEADRNEFSARRRMRLRLELAEVQRKQANVPGADPDSEWIAAAEQTVRQALQIAADSGDAPGYVDCLDSLALIFLDRRRWDAAASVLQEASRLVDSLPGPDPLRVAQRVYRLGIARHMSGRVEEATEPLEQALALHEKTYGEEHLETANLLGRVGRIFRAQGDQERAQDCLRRALRTHRFLLGDSAPQVFEDLQQLAGSLEDAGDLEGAAEQFEIALHIKQRQLGISHLVPFAEMQYSLANLYTGWGNYSRARELLAECIGTFRNTGGARLAVSYEMLAQVQERCGLYQIALSELENAGRAWERCGTSRTAELVHNLEYRADLLEEMRQPRRAYWLRQQATELRASISEDWNLSEMAAGSGSR